MLLVLVLGVGFAACGSDSDSDGGSGAETSQSGDTAGETAENGIEGVTWSLMNIATQGSATSLPDTVKAPTVRFEDGKVQIFGGCNNGAGKAEIGEKEITFGGIAMTKKACAGIASQVEAYVTLVLQGKVGYEVEQGNLNLERKQISLIFTQD